MMVLRHGGGNQVVPVDYQADVSQRLVEASLSNDLKSAFECVSDPFVDVNYIGVVAMKIRKADVVLGEEEEKAIEVRVGYVELRMDVTALFVAASNGSLHLVRKLLSVGADVNQRLFRGFATTAAVREGHAEILEVLVKAGASQPACEEALLEASNHGHSHLVEQLMCSDLIRPHVAVHALVTACIRGFVEVVDALMRCGVDANSTDRVLLQSSKPSLHTNVDCNALVAAVVSRQISVVRLLLETGVKHNVKVQLGAWSWDMASGEEFRVGAGLAEPYSISWCAVEYFESTGSILQMLLQYTSLDMHYGRSLLQHAILCGNDRALKVLLKSGAQTENPIKTTQNVPFHPIHMAARLGHPAILQTLIDSGCDLNSRAENGDTALMIAIRYKQEKCLQVLAKAGADLSMVNSAGQSASLLARSHHWFLIFQQVLLNIIRIGNTLTSTNRSVFSPLLFVAQAGDVLGLKALLTETSIDLNEQDEKGFSAVMIAAMEGHVAAFRMLVYAGVDVKLCSKSGETALTLSRLNNNRDLFEKVMLEFALEKENRIAGGFYALHCAARRGDLDAVKLLTSKGYDINASDGDGYTPLMLAAREGNAKICDFLITRGANCDAKNSKGESALSLARKLQGLGSDAENVILNALARKLVLGGSRVRKHTKSGKGAPHVKLVKMMGSTGILHWGKSSCRNVVCREAEVGASLSFQKNRRKKGDGNLSGIFRVVTTKNKEVHFVCDGGAEMAELWVRGIRLVTREAIFDK